MKTRILGNSGIEVSAVGFGCMGLSHAFGTPLEKEDGAERIRAAVDMGYTLLDTAECYTGTNPDGTTAYNEDAVGLGIRGIRDKVILATKTGVDFVNGQMVLDSSPERIRRSLEKSLDRLGTDHIDLYYQHRIDPKVEPETVAETMGQLIKEGKIRSWGISCVNEDYLRRAHAVTPVAAVEEMYNMIDRKIEKQFSLLDELNIALVAYTPLAKGFLSGRYRERPVFNGKEDNRKGRYQFSEEGFLAYQAVIDLIREYGEKKQASPTQITLAWEMAKRPYIIPIPGTRTPAHMKENLEASETNLTSEEVREIDDALDRMNLVDSSSRRTSDPYQYALKK